MEEVERHHEIQKLGIVDEVDSLSVHHWIIDDVVVEELVQ